MALGDKIRMLREELNLSQKELANLAGVTTGVIAEWEADETAPDLAELARLCKALNISSDVLLEATTKDVAPTVPSLEQESKPIIVSTKKKTGLIIGITAGIVALAIGAFFLLKMFPFLEDIPTTGTTGVSVTDFSNNPDRIAEAAKSVVKINCYKDGDITTTGSGFAAFKEGVIITNYHVIEEMPSRIEIVTETGQKCDIYGGIGASKERDVAILYYDSSIDLPVLSVALNKSLTKGEKVVAIGSPLGLTNVVSTGVFSGYTNIGNSTDIQFTASISNGSSGGALFNDKGEVIGITYASLEAGQNLNLAVPIEFVEALWKNGRQGALSLNGFFEELIPHYSVSYVLGNYEDLKDQTFYLDCWYSSYGKDEDGYVVFVAEDYEDIYDPKENKNEIRFIEDRKRYSNADMIKLAGFGTGHLDELHVEILYDSRGKQESVKCKGVRWSSADEKPYIIVE